MGNENLKLIENEDFRGDSFRGLITQNVRYVNCNFGGADLEDAIFISCLFDNCKFKRANLKNAKGLYSYQN
jgi:uncharacterized protein YjbI with pentapeptide repeats